MSEIKMHWIALIANKDDKIKSLKMLSPFERRRKKEKGNREWTE